MTTTATIRHSATEKQTEFIKTSTRSSAFIGGIGSGKTTASVLRALSQPPTIGMLVAPTYTMLKDSVLKTFMDIARPVLRSWHAADMRAILINDAEILFRSSDNPERLRGPNLGWVGLDEAALMEELVYNIALGRIRKDPGRIWLTSTPKGRRHWLYKVAARAGDDMTVVRAATMDNPYLPPDFVEALKRQYSQDFYRQEVLGEFVAFDAPVFLQPAYYAPGALPIDGYAEATGCDFAYTSKAGDFTAFIRGRSKDGIVYITDLYHAQVESIVWADELRAWPNPFALIGGQEKGIAGFLQFDYDIPIRVERAVSDKLARARRVAAAWNRGEVRLPADSGIARAIEEEVRSFTGNHKLDEHDDIVDALAALYAALDPHGFEFADPVGWD